MDGSVLSSLWSFAGRLCGDWLGSGVPVCGLVDNIGQWYWSTAVAVGSVWRRTVFVFFLAEHSPCILRASASCLALRARGDSRSAEIKGGPWEIRSPAAASPEALLSQRSSFIVSTPEALNVQPFRAGQPICRRSVASA